MSSKSTHALKAQKKTFVLCVVGFCLVFCGLVYLMTDSGSPPSIPNHKIDLPGDKINSQDMWMNKIENEKMNFEHRLKFLESLILDNKKQELEKENDNQALRQELSRLKNEMKIIRETPKALSEAVVQNEAQTPITNATGRLNESSIISMSPYEDPFVQVNRHPDISRKERPPLKEYVMGKAAKTTFHVDKAIPAGTSVRALLVSSIDAPCGVYSSSDPQPVKLRLLDDGHLPKEVMARLKGGLIIASAYGDISTERVYMRLERLTKVERSGEFIETGVTGFVSGEDGKFGVRGVVVDKSGRLVANAACSGFFSGVSQFLNASTVSAQSNKCDNPNPFGWSLLQSSGLQGTSSAFDTLADYYIRRAEQIMPVIQVAAGRIVDITFTHKAELGDLYTQEKVREIREISRRDADG